MSSTNLLLLAITSVFVACNQLGIDPEVLPYLIALAGISIGLALVAMRKSDTPPTNEQTLSEDAGIRRCVSPRERRC